MRSRNGLRQAFLDRGSASFPEQVKVWTCAGFLVSGAALLSACASPTPRLSEAVRVSSYELRSDREPAAGGLFTVSGYLLSAHPIGKNTCFKVLVDESLPVAPDLLIGNRGWAKEPVVELDAVYEPPEPAPRPVARSEAAARTEPAPSGDPETRLHSEASVLGWMGRLLPNRWSASLPVGQRLEAQARQSRAAAPAPPRSESRAPDSRALDEERGEPDLRMELARAEAFLQRHSETAGGPPAAVIQACRLPPTRANRKALKHALEWLKPLEKPERIKRAPTLETVRRELQVFYLERSREYDWAPLLWEEIALTGMLLDPGDTFEEEVIGGVDMVPYAVGIHDPQRGRWLFIDLSSGDSYSKELMTDLIRDLPPRLLRKAGDTAVRGSLP
jgi:hypothetical protein